MKYFSFIIFFAWSCSMPSFAQTLDPESEGTIILFSQACLNMYPSGDSAIDPWLSSPGINQLSESDANIYSRTSDSRTFKIESVTTYILSLENDNLCTVFANNINRDNLFSNWDSVRSGLAVNPSIIEEISTTSNGNRPSTHYSFSNEAGNLIMRITISTKDVEPEKTDFIISAVSAMRGTNK